MISAIRLTEGFTQRFHGGAMRHKRGWLWLLVFTIGFVFFDVPMTARAQSAEDARGVFVRTPETIRWSEQLRDIVLSHPREEVSETLNTMILEGVVVLAFDTDIVLGGDGDATVLLIPVDNSGVRIVLNISSLLLASSAERSDQYRAVYHAYLLLDKLLAGAPAEHFFARESSVPCAEDDALTIFRNEVDAYCQECQLARDMGWPTDDALCAAYVTGGSAALARVLAADLVRRPCFSQHEARIDSYTESLARSDAPSVSSR